MKNFKINFIFLALLLLTFNSCNKKELLRRMQEYEEGVHNPNTIAELEDAISKYEGRVEDILLAQNRIAIWYKMLGSRYMEEKMYSKALDCFAKAIEYYPDNHNLYYQLGLCASKLGKNYVGLSDDKTKDKRYYYELAENSYKTALTLQANYSKAAYALGVLYVYELHDPENAIKILLPLVEREEKNYDAMFVLASAYYLNKDFNMAISTYKTILKNASDENLIKSAKKNIMQIEAESFSD